jgi:hypothetical protein
MADGVAAGAAMADQEVNSSPGTTASPIIGTSGKLGCGWLGQRRGQAARNGLISFTRLLG